MAHAKMQIVSGVVRVYEEGTTDPDSYVYICNFRTIPGERRVCELFGVMAAPTMEQLRAIHKLLRALGYDEYIRTTGVGEQRRWKVKGN